MAALSHRPVSDVAVMPHRLPDVGDPAVAIAAAMASTVAVAILGGAVAVLARRLAGGFTANPQAALTWTVAAGGLAILAVIDGGVRAGFCGTWAGIATRLGLVTAVLAVLPVGPRGSVVAGLVALGLTTTAAVVPRGGLRHPAWRDAGTGRLSRARAPSAPPEPRPDASEASPAPAGFRQRLERFQTLEDGDRIIGRLLVDVPAGGRTGHGHLGFCPPFSTVPGVEVTSEDDGIEVVVSAAEIVPWGVRVECRLSEAAEEPLAIPVHVVASSPASPRTLP